MKPLTTEEVRQVVHGWWLARRDAATVRGVSIDSRTARAGELFIAIRGDRFDGHRFLRSAADAGCAGAVVRRDHNLAESVAGLFPGGVIGVQDTRRALGDLAGHCRSHMRAAVVAVTGSNGKTTVKRMIHHILSGRLTGTCSSKSFNNDIGVPLTLLGAGAGDDYVVCEVGSNAPGEVLALTRICRPDVAVITSVGPAHLEKLGSIERVAGEKASLLEGLREGGLAAIWGDSELLSRAVGGYPVRPIRFGASDACDLRLTNYQGGGRSCRFELNGRLWVDLPLPGRHNAVNALAAIAVAQRFGIGQDEAAAALRGFEGVDMRLEWIDAGGGTIINDAYNANPDSVVAAADVLVSCEARRRVIVIGDMAELGPTGEELHRQAGRQIAAQPVHLVIGVGPLGGLVAEGAGGDGMAAEAFGSVGEAAGAIGGLLQAGDVVLVKGSRTMAMEQLIAPMRAALEKVDAGPDGEAGQGHPE